MVSGENTPGQTIAARRVNSLEHYAASRYLERRKLMRLARKVLWFGRWWAARSNPLPLTLYLQRVALGSDRIFMNDGIDIILIVLRNRIIDCIFDIGAAVKVLSSGFANNSGITQVFVLSSGFPNLAPQTLKNFDGAREIERRKVRAF